jgi:predicted O-methyltransferase YrrM
MQYRRWIIIVAVVLCVTVGFFAIINVLRNNKQEPITQVIEKLPEPFKNTLISMYEGQDQLGTDGKMHKLDLSTSISPEQGMCIYNLCQEKKPQKTLEIGFAYGFSTIYFLASIKSNNLGSHTAMDPFQHRDWYGIGLKKITELEMDGSFRFIPDYDVFGIPQLAKENHKFDVVFIDGDHRFDYVLMDFTLCDYIISENGYIIFHDTGMKSIKKVVKFIKKNRSDYKIHDDITSPQMLIVKKISNDEREWNHYKSF